MEKIVNSLKLAQNVISDMSKLPLKKEFEVIESNAINYLDGKWDFMTDDKDKVFQIKVPSSWHTVEQYDHEENFKESTTAWYHYAFSIESIEDNSDLMLCFGAVSTVCNVYLNGVLLGYHGGRYTPFEFNINDAAQVGVNHLVLCVGDMSHAVVDGGKGLVHQVGLLTLNGHTPDPFMPENHGYGGILREVYIQARHKVRSEKTHIITSVKNKDITVGFNVTENVSKEQIEMFVTDMNGETVSDVDFKLNIENNKIIAHSKWENPKLWGQTTPYLYHLTIKINGNLCEYIRFGFREIEIVGPDLFLNGKILRLFGESINLSQMYFMGGNRKDYVKLLFNTLKKEANLNCVRIHSAISSKSFLEAADETGMLILAQSGLWSSAAEYYNHSKAELLDNVKKEFTEWIWRDINNPSIIAWDVENELMRGSRKNDWPMGLDAIIREMDDTKPVLHSGAGGLWKKCDMYHLHHNEQYQYIIEKWLGDKDKPLMIGEWWIGGRSGTPRNVTGLDHKLYEIYESDQAKLHYERIVELRTMGVTGVMPYDYITYLFHPVFDFRQKLSLTSDTMEPCPDFANGYSDSIGIGKELVNPNWDSSRPKYLLSNSMRSCFNKGFAPLATFFKNRNRYLESGKQTKQLCLINDTEYDQNVEVELKINFGVEETSKRFSHSVKQGEIKTFDVGFDLPFANDDAKIFLEVTTYVNGIQMHQEEISARIMAQKAYDVKNKIALYDTEGKTTKMFKDTKIDFVSISEKELETIDKSNFKILAIGSGSGDEFVTLNRDSIDVFVKNGGKVWIMEQEKVVDLVNYPLSLIPSMAQTTVDYYDIGEHEPLHNGLNYSKYLPVYAPEHDIFAGLDRLIEYFNNNDNRILDTVYAKPITICKSLLNLRVLSGGTKQEQCSALEFLHGDGVYLFTQFRLCDNYEKEPMAKRLLQNIMKYLDKGVSEKSNKVAVIGDKTYEVLSEKSSTVFVKYENAEIENYQTIIIGGETRYDDKLQSELESFVKNGGVVVLSKRQSGEDFDVFGNKITVETDYHSNSIFFHTEFDAVSGMYGSDFELEGYRHIDTDTRDVNFPVQNTLRVNGVYDESNQMHANLWKPLAELVYKNKTFWWYNAPKANNGYAAIEVEVGKGKVIVWQLDMLEKTTYAQYFTSVLLTNLNVQIPSPKKQASSMNVIFLKDLEMDADFTKWICDMEDSNVTRYRHADCMTLMTQHLSSGNIYSNVQCSGLVYLMYDKNYLYGMTQVVDNGKRGDGVSAGADLKINDTVFSTRLAPDDKMIICKDGVDCSSECKGTWQGITGRRLSENIDAARIYSSILDPFYSAYVSEFAIPLELIGADFAKCDEFLIDSTLYHTSGDGEVSTLTYSQNMKESFYAIFEK